MFKSLILATMFLFGTLAHAAPVKPTVVMFWTTYCSYCKAEIPILDRLARSGKARVIGVVMDKKGNEGKVRAIIKRYKPSFNLDGHYRAPGKIYGVPTIFIVKNGKVVKVFHRSTSPGEIDRYL